ncbi:hypothetical protein AMTRI_Chr01g104740 [Amborella trichopoda]
MAAMAASMATLPSLLSILPSSPRLSHSYLFPLSRNSIFRGSAVPRELQFQKIALSPIRASSSNDPSSSTEDILSDLKEKWDAVENKSTVLIYGGGALVALWLSSVVLGAINSVPLLPKIMELVGLGYAGWFIYRYLLFKSSRKELVSDIEELKQKITGSGE